MGALARRRSYRKAREEKPRTQPAVPRPLLSTVPFAAVLAVLAILTVAIILIAFPGAQLAQKPKQQPVHEQGVAPRGWYQEAQKQFHK